MLGGVGVQYYSRREKKRQKEGVSEKGRGGGDKACRLEFCHSTISSLNLKVLNDGALTATITAVCSMPWQCGGKINKGEHLFMNLGCGTSHLQHILLDSVMALMGGWRPARFSSYRTCIVMRGCVCL